MLVRVVWLQSWFMKLGKGTGNGHFQVPVTG